MLAPNHCRMADPLIVGAIANSLAQPLFFMSSAHAFMQSRLQAWVLPRLGAFSVYREGMDRESLRYAVQVLTQATRPLVVFPEGTISRTNDRLNPLLDGVAFMARQAAKQRRELNPPGKVVVHPVALRYRFAGDIHAAVTPVLEDIERRLSWAPQKDMPLPKRITRVGEALLTLKELEYADKPRSGTLGERIDLLIDQLLDPLEREWLKSKREGSVNARVKALRAAILPDMIGGEDGEAEKISESERVRRWKQLAEVYLAQQLSFYPPDYFSDPPTHEQLLETVERFEEDLTDVARVHRPIHATVRIGGAIEVSPDRDRKASADPLMLQIKQSIESMLAEKDDPTEITRRFTTPTPLA